MVSKRLLRYPALIADDWQGLRDMFGSGLVVAAAFSTCTGGLLFGFDQGILSIVLTMPQFLEQFPDININVSSSAAFNKG